MKGIAIFKIKNMERIGSFQNVIFTLYLNINRLILLRRMLKKFKKIENCRISRQWNEME